MNITWPATPCGAISRSIFNDTFKIIYLKETNNTNQSILISETGRAWTSDV